MNSKRGNLGCFYSSWAKEIVNISCSHIKSTVIRNTSCGQTFDIGKKRKKSLFGGRDTHKVWWREVYRRQGGFSLLKNFPSFKPGKSHLKKVNLD
jgi:hypothetical protein